MQKSDSATEPDLSSASEQRNYWIGDWGGRVTILFGFITLAHFAFLWYQWGGEEYIDIVNDSLTSILYFAAFIVIWRVSTLPDLTPRSKNAWRLIAAAYFCYGIGSILWGYFEVIAKTAPFPSWADPFYLLYFPILLAGLVLLSPRMESWEERIKLGLDAAIVTLGSGMILWYFLLQPMAEAGKSDPLTNALALSYPVGDLVMLFGMLLVYFQRPAARSGPSLNLLMIGIVVQFFADLIFGYLNLKGTYKSGMLADVLFVLSGFVVMLSAHCAFAHSLRAPELIDAAREKRNSFSLLPYVAIALGYGLLVMFASENADPILSSLIGAAAVLTFLVVSRQIFAMREIESGKVDLQKLKERFDLTTRATNDAIWDWDLRSDALWWNEGFQKMFGYAADEVGSDINSWKERVHPDDHGRVSNRITAFIHQREAKWADEYRFMRSDGSFADVSDRGYIIFGEGGEPLRMVGSMMDISERNLAENMLRRSEEQHRLLFENNPQPSFVWDIESFEFLAVNEATILHYGYSREELLMKMTLLDIRPADDVPSFLQRVEEMTPERRTSLAPFRHQKKDGTIIDVEVTSQNLEFDGRRAQLVLVNDVTERLRAEAALEQSRDYLNRIINAVADPIFVNDRQHRMLLVNDAFCQLEGRTREEMIGKAASDFCSPDEARIFLGMDNLVFETGEPTSNEEGFTDTNGERRVLMTKKTLYKNPEGEEFIVGSIRDITNLKFVEEELSASKALLTKFIEHAPAAVAMFDTEMNYLQVSQRWLTDYKIVVNNIIGKSHYEIFPNLPEVSKEIHRRCLAGEILTDDGDPFQQNDGTTDWLQWETRPWHKPGGEIGGIILYTQIITGRKQNEELIRQSEEKYRNILESIEEGYFETDLRGHFTFFNEALSQSLGYDRDELMRADCSLFTDEENYRKIYEIFTEVFKTNRPSQVPNWEIVRRNGERRVHESSVSLVRNSEDQPVGFRGLVRDITDRKRAEIESQVISEIIRGTTNTSNVEELLQIVYESLSKAIYAENFYIALYDKQTDLINLPFCRDKFDEIAVPQKLGSGLTAYLFRHGRPALLTNDDINGLIADGEIELVGTPPAVWLGIPLRTPAGIIGVMVVQHYENDNAYSERDIELLTSAGDQIALAIERKAAEDELKESREWLAAMFEASRDGIIVEENEHVVFVNNRYSLMCGFEDRELIGTHISKLLTPEDCARMTEYGRMRSRGEEVPSVYEFKGINRDGIATDYEASISTFTSKGKFYIVTAQKDITERNRAVEELKRGEALQRQLAERQSAILGALPAHICLLDHSGIILEVNEEWLEFFRESGHAGLDYRVGANYIDACERSSTLCGDIAGDAAEICRSVLSGASEVGTLEYSRDSSDGKSWYRMIVTPLEKWNQAGAVVMHLNITASKRLETERQVVAEIIQGIAATSNLNELLELANQSLKKVIYAENCFVALHDPQTDQITFEHWADQLDPIPSPQSISKSFSNYVLRTGKPLLLTEQIEAELLAGGVVKTIGSESPSWLGVPLKTPERIIGVLVLQHYTSGNVYGQRDLEFLTTVGDQIALAVERKRADEKIRISEQEQRSLAEHLGIERTRLERAQSVAKVGSWEADLQLGSFSWSAETYRIFEVEPDAFGGRQREFLKIVHPEDRKLVYQAINDAMGQVSAKPLDHRILLPDGRIKVVRERWQVLSDERGTPMRLLGTTQDITAQKRDEEKLKASELRLSEAQHMAGLGSWEWDVDLRSVVWSDEFYRIFGFEPKQIEPTFDAYLSFVHPDDLELVTKMRNKAMDGEREYDYFHRFFKSDGELRVARSKGLVTLGIDGNISKITGTIQDITAQKELENELKHTRDAALETARLKSEFLANMSHENRTPMNGVVGMTGLLLDTDLSPRQHEYAETIQSSADSLLTIIDDILDFSKIESGLLRFENIDFDLRSAVESPLALLAEKAQAKGLEVASLVYNEVPTALRGDPGRLRQVLTNLIGNAVKFTDIGEVVVSVQTEREDGDNIVLRFEIKDTGIGISKEAQSRLFQAFTQADGSTTRKYGGTGLGLAISKQLVELMDGEIGIESSPGNGSTFWFTGRFERQAGSLLAAGQASSANLTNLRVLVIDDNATNRKIMVHQSLSWGMLASEADSGKRALELLHEAADAGLPFDIALLDLMMPEMDGFQLADEIKKDPKIAGVAIVLLPSFGQRGHGDAARDAGIAAYLQKPVRQSQLFDCLVTVVAGAENNSGRELITQHSLTENKMKRDHSPVPANARILVAEDNPVNQKVALGQLENLGYKATAVRTGLEVLKLMESTVFDIIFMDCQMPEMDGFEATAEIRRLETNGRRTTIVAMTANALEGDREKCLSAGMDDYLSKPVKSEILSGMLTRWLKSGEEDAASIRSNGDSKSVDFSVIEGLREMQQTGMPDFVTEVIDLFLEDASLQLEQLRIALAADDSEERKRLAHLIKGSSANVGADEMARLLDELEHSEMNAEDGKTAFGVLANEFQRVKADLSTERRVN